MATASQPEITLTSVYVDITVANPALANADVELQYRGVVREGAICEVICATTAVGGPTALQPLDSWNVNAAHIWVRGEGVMSATLV